MASYTQDDRPIRVKTALAKDDLLLMGFDGRESVSRPFAFQLELMSEDPNIKADAVLRKGATISVKLADGSERHINGVINRFVQAGSEHDLAYYRAELVPWLWFLSLSSDCKVFQNKSVLDIIEEVFSSLGYSDYSLNCTRSYPQREYCVQYRETHLDFVCRLMEEEGIFFFFEHTETKHTLVLADSNSTFDPFPGFPEARVAVDTDRDEDAITELEREDAVFVGKVTLRDYDPLQPSLTLKSTMSGDGKEEIYDYRPVIYTELSEGDRYSRLRLETEEALQRVVRGGGTCRYFQSGCSVQLKDHYRADMNKEVVLLDVEHSASAGDYRAWDHSEFEYQVRFSAIPSDVVYRPQRVTPKPFVRGTQTAVVVGKSGEEIWTDKHGRVKVQFHWDREGANDDTSSLWVRVSSVWAGKKWGGIYIPRIGQEVIVDFLEGDPDRPIITGRVYNAEQMPPYTLPADQTQSGVKSRSSKGGGTDNFNEIRMEDKKGSELLYVHAEKNKKVMVENDRTENVGHDEMITIGNDRTEDVGNDETIKIGNDRTEEVGNNEKIAIANNRTEDVGNNETITIGNNRTEDVGNNEKITIGSSRKEDVGANETVKIGANRKVEVGAGDKLKVGTTLKIEAGISIELKAGGNSIKIDPSGITIKGLMVTIDAQTILKAKGGAMGQFDGGGMAMIKGGIVMIN